MEQDGQMFMAAKNFSLRLNDRTAVMSGADINPLSLRLSVSLRLSGCICVPYRGEA